MSLEKSNEYWSEKFRGLDFSNQEITNKEFEVCTFKECNFSEAIFRQCNFVDCEFSQCNLSMVNFAYSRFSDVSFRESKLIGIDWTKVSWPELTFSSPFKFYQSLISDCSFYGLSLQEITLEECKAHNVDFREADFSQANFAYTDLAGSFFNRTNLSGANFLEATNYDIDIYQNQIKNAKFSRHEAVRLLESLDIELVD